NQFRRRLGFDLVSMRQRRVATDRATADPQHVRRRSRLARPRCGARCALGAPRQSKPVHLADDRVARDAAEFARDLTGGKPVGPQLLQQLDPLVSPRHALSSSKMRLLQSARNRPPRQATLIAQHPNARPTLSRNCPPHEISYLTVKSLQYGPSRA